MPEEALEQTLPLNPEPAEGLYLLGLVQQHQKDFASAAESFRKAYESPREALSRSFAALWRGTFTDVLGDIQFVELAIQARDADAQVLGGLRLCRNCAGAGCRGCAAARTAPCASLRSSPTSSVMPSTAKGISSTPICRALGEDDGALDHVLQLAHVAAPVMIEQRPHRAVGQSRHALVHLRRVLVQEMMHQQRDIFLALPQRRQLQASPRSAGRADPRGTRLSSTIFSRSWFDAAMMRTSIERGCVSPTGVTTRSSSTRSSELCTRHRQASRSRRGRACRRWRLRSSRPCRAWRR